MNINSHPIWKGVSVYKKPFHLLRINIAKQYAKLFPQETFIGVTGSVGKTTTVNACKKVLSLQMKTIATTESSSQTANLDPIFNIPITILRLRPGIKRAILEMGIEHPGDMDFNLSFVHPKIGIVTRIAYAHSEFLGGLDQILEEKGKLIESLPKDGVAILNWDDIYSRKLAEKTKAQVLFYGKDPQHCLVWPGNIQFKNFRTIFELNCGVERVKVDYKLIGEHQIYPSLAAATLGLVENISLIKIKNALEALEPESHRLQPVEGPNSSVILDDTYNSSPAALEAAIDTLLSISARRRIVVLGEMKELGPYSETLHRQIAARLYKEKLDMVLLGQGDTNFVADELQRLGFWEERLVTNLTNTQIVQKLLKTLSKGDVCLIKASHAVRYDEVVKRIAKK